jgi:undecaprenyl-diphosphatase
MSETLLAVLLGVIQGVLEWLPVSSEGAVAVVGAVVGGSTAGNATRLALFLHGGTAISALAYYRSEVVAVAGQVRGWDPRDAFATETADLSFLTLATLATGVVGLPAYVFLLDAFSTLTGGGFVALVGGLLVVTGLLQRFADRLALATRSTPDWLDALLVGGLQGLAILPGVSRSGTTVSALLLRGHDGESSLQLSFLLSIPAAIAGNLLVVLSDGIPAIEPVPALLALAVSAVVGYLTVDALVRLVRRVPFWGVCVGFGTLGVVGGALLLI